MATIPFRHPISVRYYEVDQQSVVFNMWYLGYFDDALTGFMDSLGLPYDEMMGGGHDLMLVRSEVDWTGSVRFQDDVSIGVAVESIGTTSFTLNFDVLANGNLACRGRTVYVVVATDGSGKRAIPAGLRQQLELTRSDPADQGDQGEPAAAPGSNGSSLAGATPSPAGSSSGE